MTYQERVLAKGLQFIKASGNITPVEISRYIEETAVILHPAQKALIEETIKHPKSSMMGDVTQLAWFRWLIRLIGGRKIVDVGVFTGCSTLAAALAVPVDGRVYGFDTCEEFVNIGRPFFKQAGVEDKIDIRICPAIAGLDCLLEELGEDSIDFVFIDAVKHEYLEYYERALKLVRPHGVIAFDN
ncbi:hypothetical protein BIW11_01054, partial [Tropilaelaps mercedesae]